MPGTKMKRERDTVFTSRWSASTSCSAAAQLRAAPPWRMARVKSTAVGGSFTLLGVRWEYWHSRRVRVLAFFILGSTGILGECGHSWTVCRPL